MRIGLATMDWSDATEPHTLGGAGEARVGIPSRFTSHEVAAVGGLIVHRKTGEMGVADLDGEHHWDCDTLVLQRYMHGDIAGHTKRARAQGQVVIHDVDDWFFGLDPANSAFAATQRRDERGRERDQHRHFYQANLAAADGVIASTDYLAARLATMLHRPVAVWRNCLDVDRWQVFNARRHAGMPRVGWVGATSHRSGDLEVLQGVLGPWMRQRDAAPLVHAGHRPGARQTAWRAWAVHADEVVAVNLQPAPTYPMLLGTMDVGLVPLRMAPFNMAKSNIKGLEYAAAGVPFIATPTDEYRRLATEGVGLLAARPAHWRRHLDGLMDAEHRQRVADMARAYVLDQYDARRCIGAWDKLVLELAG